MRGFVSVLLLLWAGPAAAQDCVHDDALARTALEVMTAPAALDGDDLTRLARAAGSDAPTFRAVALPSGDAERRAAWLGSAAERDGALACGEADDGTRTVLVVAPRLAHLSALTDAPPHRVRAELLAELESPVLYVLDANGTTVALEVEASPDEIDLDPDLALPARIQLVATGVNGPRPVAVLELGEPAPTAAVIEDATPRERLLALAYTDDPSPIRSSHLLDGLATEHAEAVCAEGVVGHELEPGLEPEERIRRRGVTARHVGEVVARGETEAAAWTALAASPSHLFALRDRRFTDAGIGTATDADGRTCVVVLLAAWPRYVGIH